jgi:hypothetical protein
MDEAAWLACNDPRLMLEFLRETAGEWRFVTCACCRAKCVRSGGVCPAYRKLKLYACGCCRRVLSMLPEPECLAALEAAERYADGDLDEAQCSSIAHVFDTKRRSCKKYGTPDDGAWNALYCAVHRRWQSYLDEDFALKRCDLVDTVVLDAAESAGVGEAAVQATLLRDVIGNPFRPLLLDLAWRTPTVLALAQAAYDNRILPSGHLEPDRLAVLADALEESGCTDAEILGHLRGPGPHVRGCFLVDAILTKT